MISVVDSWGIDCEIALRWMSLDLSDYKSTLVQVMAWCRQATSHYLNQSWLRCLTPSGVTRPQWGPVHSWTSCPVHSRTSAHIDDKHSQMMTTWYGKSILHHRSFVVGIFRSSGWGSGFGAGSIFLTLWGWTSYWTDVRVAGYLRYHCAQGKTQWWNHFLTMQLYIKHIGKTSNNDHENMAFCYSVNWINIFVNAKQFYR